MKNSRLPLIIFSLWILLSFAFPKSILAQNTGVNQGTGGNAAGGNGAGGVGGIRINADGLVAKATNATLNGRDFQKQLDKSAARSLSTEMNQISPQRKISLRNLDAEITRLLDEAEPLPASVQNLAGLTRIDYLFIDVESNDVIVAGPAEGFASQSDGRAIGSHSHRPVLCLDDLLVALRTSDNGGIFGCSFDPDQERLAKSQQLLRQNRIAASAQDAQQGFLQIGDVLGNWKVSVFGVPASSHAAASFVEADFVLKQLTTGDINPQVRGFRSYLSLMRPNADSMRRWWFSPLYDAVETNEKQTVWHLAGPRLQVSAQDEIVDASGNRKDAPTTHVSLEKYAQQFTDKIPLLAEKVPAIAQLQNLVDLFVLAAVMERARIGQQLEWKPLSLNDERRLPLQVFGIPRETPSVVKVRMAGSTTVLGLIAGGVTVVPHRILADAKATGDSDALALFDTKNHNSSWWWD